MKSSPIVLAELTCVCGVSVAFHRLPNNSQVSCEVAQARARTVRADAVAEAGQGPQSVAQPLHVRERQVELFAGASHRHLQLVVSH